MIMEIPYKDAATSDDALSMDLKLRDGFAARVPG